MDAMGIISWIILGGLAGWVASMIVGNNREQGVIGNIVVGIIGAFLGGFIVSLFGGSGVTGFNLWSFLVALLGAVVALFIWRAVSGRSHRVTHS
ncbi:MAG: transglycosylase [Candidatus Saccharibacteria bacterium]|nr:transglycosylase [Candidatus Saccharibacteria bacterium]